MDDHIGRSILVSGKVQGVFFRASTQKEAQMLGLSGWVKNLPTGEVLIEVFGPYQVVETLMRWCKVGPPMAEVAHVKIHEIPFREEKLFLISY
ncbi:acylphosphatase [Reichenbachiella faecimaris]|nr:acylphosphatase [Reichenbachiella faecimaris]